MLRISFFKLPNYHYLFGSIDIKRLAPFVVFGLSQHFTACFFSNTSGTGARWLYYACTQVLLRHDL